MSLPPRCHHIAGRDVDLGVGQFCDEFGDCAGPILALNQEAGLWAHQGKFCLPGYRLKGCHIDRNEIELGSPPFGKASIDQ